MRRSYHTQLKIAVRLGKCPTSVIGQIPKSNISKWKQEQHNKYYNGGIVDLDKYTHLLETIQAQPKIFYAYGRLVRTLLKCFEPSTSFFNSLRNSKKEIVQTIERIKQAIPIKKAVKLFRISIHTYYEWKSQVELPCTSSVIKSCKSRKPFQLTQSEVLKMEKLLTIPDFSHWSIASIHHYAKRNSIITASLNTWYKYNHLMKWRRTKARQKKTAFNPLIASHPNQYWHMDITIFRTQQGIKYFIQALMDNYSRKVLGWSVSDRISGRGSVKVIEQAIQTARKYHPDFISYLVVDGGSENHNSKVDSLLTNQPIIKLTAQKDIASSNSMIEAKNKLIKYNCLYKKDIPDKEALIQALAGFFEEENAKRPLHSLAGFTPDEVYIEGKNPDTVNFKEDYRIAREKRIAINKNDPCRLCVQ